MGFRILRNMYSRTSSHGLPIIFLRLPHLHASFAVRFSPISARWWLETRPFLLPPPGRFRGPRRTMGQTRRRYPQNVKARYVTTSIEFGTCSLRCRPRTCPSLFRRSNGFHSFFDENAPPAFFLPSSWSLDVQHPGHQVSRPQSSSFHGNSPPPPRKQRKCKVLVEFQTRQMGMRMTPFAAESTGDSEGVIRLERMRVGATEKAIGRRRRGSA